VNGLVVDRFLHLGGGACRRVIDLGTGPGDIPILLSKRSQIPAIVGVDAAETMLALARPSAERHGVADRVTFARADVKALPYADGAFDGVFSNTILHHIPEPVVFVREAARVLAKGGVLLIRDLYRPATMDEAKRLVALHAGNAPKDHQQLLLQSLCAALTLDEAVQVAQAADNGAEALVPHRGGLAADGHHRRAKSTTSSLKRNLGLRYRVLWWRTYPTRCSRFVLTVATSYWLTFPGKSVCITSRSSLETVFWWS
jgi:SAM-dependent methyltransferase